MSATFYVVDPSLAPELDRLVDAMEQEDPLEETENSAFDAFAAVLEQSPLWRLAISEADAEPAEAFYEWFHGQVTEDLDKLYLSAEQAKKALEKLDRLTTKKGVEKVVSGFWSPAETYTKEVAIAYLQSVRAALTQTVTLNGLMAIAYS